MRVSNGEIPHRDFYANYAPANFYVLAGLFKLFSPSILTERLWDTFVRALIATFVFLIVEKWGALREAFFAYGASLVWLGFFAFYGYPIFPAFLFTLISSFFLYHLFQGSPRALLLLAGGASVGLITLFRYEVGFAIFVTESSVVAAYMLAQWNRPKTQDTLVALVRILVPYSLGVAAVFLPVAGGYLTYAPLRDFVFDLISYPSQNYVKMRSLPFPTWHDLANSPETIAIYLPFGVWAAVSVILFREKEVRRTEPGHTEPPSMRWMVILFGALSIVFYLKGLVRIGIAQVGPSIILALALLAVVAKYRSHSSGMTRAIVWLCIFIAIVPTWSAAHIVLGRIHRNIDELIRSGMWRVPANDESAIAGSCQTPIGLERIACFRLDKNRIEAIQFLQQHTRNDEVIFSGLTRHDKIFINDNMLYFVAKRQPVTKWHHFDPGLQTTAAIQNEMVSEFESKKPQFVVLESRWDDWEEPNASALSSGVTILDDYIRLHYESVRQYGTISVLARRE